MTYRVQTGLNLPKSDDRFEPGDTITDAQLAAELSKAAVERLAASGAITTDTKGGK